VGLVVCGLGLSACNPAFNWRTLRDDASPLQALMPCKPERAQREVPLGGAARSLHMHSCEAGGLTFAIAWAELDPAADVALALEQWRAASAATLRSTPSQAAHAAPELRTVPGARQTLSLQAQGTAPTGQPVQVQALYFAQQARVYQAAIYGQKLPEEVSASFFEALRLP